MTDRKAALDEFAAAQKPLEGQVMMPAVITHAAPPALVHGAQLVLTKRVVKDVLQNISALASAAGPDWYYSIPFKDKKTGRTTYAEGPSIKLADAVAGLYGNCNIDPWVSSEGLDYWEISARFIDLETGFAMTRQFRQRKDAAKIGGGDAGRNMEASYAIGESKAIRNVIVHALGTYTDFAFEQARNSLVDKIGKDIERWRQETAERIGHLVDIRRVEAVVGRPVADWLARDIAQIVAMGKAIKDGMANVNEVFPPIERQEHASTKDTLDKVSEDTATPLRSSEPGEAADDGGPADSHPEGATSAPQAASPAPLEDLQDRMEATEKLLALAADKSLEQSRRLDMLEDAAGLWEMRLEPGYFGQLVKTCVQVAKGYITQKEALKTLETIK